MKREEFRCKLDDFFLCEPGDVHEIINDTPEDFVILIFKTNEEDDDIYWQ
ncbi:MAG: cupin domain-containing protein [Nanoarchaeota archaeon]|nr:cupin domain-containing protein [Nanoarchaeota archaeon]